MLQPVVDPTLIMTGHKNSKIRLIEIKDHKYAFSLDSLQNVWQDDMSMSVSSKLPIPMEPNFNIYFLYLHLVELRFTLLRFQGMQTLINCFNDACKHLIASKAILNQLRGEKFDLAIAEFFDPCGLGIIKHVGIERWITVYGGTMALEHLGLLGVPPLASTMPGFFAKSADRGFLARLKDQLGEIVGTYYFFPMFLGRVKEAFQTFEKEEDKNMDYRVRRKICII